MDRVSVYIFWLRNYIHVMYYLIIVDQTLAKKS